MEYMTVWDAEEIRVQRKYGWFLDRTIGDGRALQFILRRPKFRKKKTLPYVSVFDEQPIPRRLKPDRNVKGYALSVKDMEKLALRDVFFKRGR
jgi:hypothetical protein